MTLHDRDPVLRRKLAPRKPPPSADDPATQGPGGALARTFSRAISEAAPLVAQQTSLHRRTASLAELIDTIDPDAFVVTLTGGSGPGLALIDHSGFAAMIEAMTIGRLATREPAPRRPTPTDAALLAGVLNASLAALGAADPVAALRCGRPVPDHRLLPVLLDEGRYDLVALTGTLGSGAVSRPVRIMLAIAMPEPVKTDAAIARAPEQLWASALEASVLLAPANLRAELGRVTMPLADVLALGVGSALMLPLSNLEEVRLVSLDGTQQAVGRLGQTRGMRAVRLTQRPGGIDAEPVMTDAAPAAARLTTQGEGAVDR